MWCAYVHVNDMYRRYSGLAEISNAGATDDVPLVALAVKRYFGSAECVATISPLY